MATSPIRFDRATGVLEGANAWERLAALALSSGSKVASNFSHRGYNGCANLLRKTLPERDIAIKLNSDATFAFPYGDGYWSKLLNRSFSYEDELELLFRDSVGVDYTLLDCGANYGYWSVLISSAPVARSNRMGGCAITGRPLRTRCRASRGSRRRRPADGPCR